MHGSIIFVSIIVPILAVQLAWRLPMSLEHFEQQATFLSTAHSLGRRVCCSFDLAIES
jgi:hypothetical protein